MRYPATINVDGVLIRARLSELSSAGSRQVAEKDRITSRMYSVLLDRDIRLTLGRPLWVENDGLRFVAYPMFQEGRGVRFHRIDGEFYPGIVLERLGMYEGKCPTMMAGGNGWFVVDDGTNVFVTEDFEIYRDVPQLRSKTTFSVVLAGTAVVLGCAGELWYSSDGDTWTGVSLGAGAGNVTALAWDGVNVLAAADSGLYRLQWSDKTVIPIDTANEYAGLSNTFSNPAPYRARVPQSGAGMDILTHNGSVFRYVDLTAGWTHNFVENGSDALGPLFTVTDLTGKVWEFGKMNLVEVGRVERGDRENRLPATFVLRGVVVVVAFGQLLRVDATGPRKKLEQVYDFGGDVQAYPSLLGPVIVRKDGLAFRVRRTSYGAL